MFALRIDIDTARGLKKGVPKILDLLDRYGYNASFYCVMGGESSIFEILRYRKKLKSERSKNIKIFSKKELLRMVLLPHNFAEKNKRILKRIIAEEHDLGVHGWKHRAWTRALERIDIDDEFRKMIRKHEQIMGRKPESLCSPAFRVNDDVLMAIDNYGFKFDSDLDGSKPFHPRILEKGSNNKKTKKKIKLKHLQIPITIKGNNNIPIIEELVAQGKSDDEIVDVLIKRIKKDIKNNKISTMYVHGAFECDMKIELMDKLFSKIKKEKIKVGKLSKIYERYK